MAQKKETPDRIALFQKKQIRRTLYKNEWWFVISDVVAALTDSSDPQGYVKDIRRRDPEMDKGWGQIATPLSIPTAGGAQNLNCANTEGLFRLIQSIPSPKAEPFKRWLAKVGYERVQEIENPELAAQRSRALYKAKGYSDDWIEKRMRSIAIRDELTDEWKDRGVKEHQEYAILTAEISKAAFGLTPGEASTTEITRHRDAQGFVQSREAARAGGSVPGDARRDLESKSGKPVVSQENYVGLSQGASKQLSKAPRKLLKTKTKSREHDTESSS